jgi:hypothetical protein
MIDLTPPRSGLRFVRPIDVTGASISRRATRSRAVRWQGHSSLT